MQALTVEDHGEPQRLQALLTAEGVVEANTATALLPITLLEQEAHGGTTGVAGEDGLEAGLARRGGEDGRGDELVPLGRVVPGADAVRVRGDAPHVGLGGGARGDLVGVLQRRVLDLQHAAGGAGGDVVEGDDGDVVVGAGAGAGAAAGQVEDLARVRVVRVTPLQDVDVGGAEGAACTGDEGHGLRLCVCRGGGMGKGDADEQTERGGEVGGQMHFEGDATVSERNTFVGGIDSRR